ncbi:MAG: pyrroline-5-carboxylate reductase [Chloroflexota bacterium]
MKVTFVGGGTMAEAIIGSLVHGGAAKADDIRVIDPVEARRELLQREYSVCTFADPSACIENAELIVLAVKPQDLDNAARQVGALSPDQLVLSILAGVKLERLQRSLAHDAIVRAMPNTPARIGRSMTVWTSTLAVNDTQRDVARSVLGALGVELYVPDEKYLDMATALSGSGPAYVFLFVEALVDGAVRIGMPRAMAQKLAETTILGSVEYLRSSGAHAAELRGGVTSPGGTTAAALHELEKGSLRSVIAEAIAAAYDKSKTL